MRLYFKNRRSPKAYKVVITSLDNSRIGFIGEITNPTMKIGNGVVQFYLAPIATEGTWTVDNNYHYKDGKLTVMAYKDLNYTNYNSHATYSDFIANIQIALEYIEFHQYQTVTDAVKAITELEGVEWTYDQENKRVIYYTDNKSGNLSLKDIATQINSFLISEDSVLKSNSELLVKEVIDDYFKPSPKNFIPVNAFNTQFVNNAVITKLGSEEYKDTYLNSKTTASLNFHQDLTDRIPGIAWYTEGEGQVVVGGEAFSNKVYYSNGVIGNSLQSPSKLLTGGSTPFTISFDVLIKEDQVKANGWPHLALFSKTTNTAFGDQFLYIQPEQQYRLAFRRSTGVGGNIINEVVGKRRIEFNTKYAIKIVYDSNMFKVFVNNELDFQFGTSIGWYVDSDQPYRFLDDFVPAYLSEGNRGFTKGFVDNIQIQDGIAEDPTKTVNAYADSLISKLTFQGQTGKANFVDEADSLINWTGYGDAKLVQTNELGLYSHLDLNGMGSYLKTTDSDYFKFNNKFTFHIKFKTSTTSKLQVLFDRYATQVHGSFQIGINPTGSLVFTKGAIPSYIDLVSSTTNLNNGSINTIDIIKDGSSLSMYINGFLDTMFDVTGDIFNADVPVTAIGAQVNTRNESYDFKGSIYEFEVYKGVAVYPNPISKDTDSIFLNFNDNVLDNYENSTWIGSQVYSQSLSDFGKAFEFSNNPLTSNKVTALDYSTDNFNLDFQTRIKEYTPVGWCTFLTSGLQNQSRSVLAYNSNDKFKRIRVDDGSLYDTPSDYFPNISYKIGLLRDNKVIFHTTNDVITATIPSDSSLSFNHNDSTTIGGASYNLGNENYIGSMDYFRSSKQSSEYHRNRPDLYLPLSNSISDLGVSGLNVTATGSLDYLTIDSLPGYRFKLNNYLTLPLNNNPLTMGHNLDFELSMYIVISRFIRYNMLLTNNTSWGEDSQSLWISGTGSLMYQQYSNNYIASTSKTIELGKKTKVSFKRVGGIYYLGIDDEFEEIPTPPNKVSLCKTQTFIGVSGWAKQADYFDGIISQIMYSANPSGVKDFDPKTVLDLDFKPTYKPYLFKDNFNKCVIHPVNISNRNYEDGQYCLKFNGINQYLQLGKNNLFNFGLDDFIISYEFKLNKYSTSTSTFLLHDGNEVNSQNGRFLIGISNETNNSESKKLHVITTYNNVNQSLFTDEEIELDKLYKVIVYRSNGILHIHLNDNLYTKEFNFPLNANSNGNTYIGYRNMTNSKSYLNGTIYSVKILRGTSNLSLLDKTVLEPESPADVILDGIPPLEPGVLQFWQPRQEVDPHNVVLEFKQLRLN